MSRRSRFGNIRKLPSGKYQASYSHAGKRHTAPTTFPVKGDASAWLAAREREISRGDWAEPEPVARRSAAPVFGEYAARIIANRVAGGLSANTASKYRGLLNGHLLPTFGPVRVDAITVAMVNDWHASYGRRLGGTRANAYRLLASIMRSAIDEGWREGSPCRVRGGAADPRRAVDAEPASPEQVERLADAMRPSWRMLVMLGAYCSLRFGELAELRRRDVEIGNGSAVIRIRRSVARVDGELIVGPPKSAAGRRALAVPPDLVGDLAAHMAEHVGPGRDALVFTAASGAQLYNAKIYRDWNRARGEVGLPGFHFHDLRHTGATWLARNGGTLKERMHRLGHSDYRMAARYEHADAERDALMAARLTRPASTSRRAGAA